jgi:16S rRNA (cytidine1402-2'-O)-methyltransferase
VATPLGNLDDITKRALQVLRDADAVLCEDTRRTAQLLRHYGIAAKKLLSNHEHNEQERAAWVVAQIADGKMIALVSDAGMPGISDPGYRTVAACVAAGLRVEALPGPSAVITAAAASGLPTDEIYFAGFPPQKKGRQTFLTRVLASEATIVLYESPYRIQTLVDEIAELATADRRVVIAREISKMHEEYLRGTAAELAAEIRKRGGLKGECVVVIEGSRSS